MRQIDPPQDAYEWKSTAVATRTTVQNFSKSRDNNRTQDKTRNNIKDAKTHTQKRGVDKRLRIGIHHHNACGISKLKLLDIPKGVPALGGAMKHPGPPPPDGLQAAIFLLFLLSQFPRPPASRLPSCDEGAPSPLPPRPEPGLMRPASLAKNPFKPLPPEEPSSVDSSALPSAHLSARLAASVNFRANHSFEGMITGLASFRKTVDSANETATLPLSMPRFKNLRGSYTAPNEPHHKEGGTQRTREQIRPATRNKSQRSRRDTLKRRYGAKPGMSRKKH